MGKVEKSLEQIAQMCKLKEAICREDRKRLSDWRTCLVPHVKVVVEQVRDCVWWDPGNEAYVSMAPVSFWTAVGRPVDHFS